MKNFFLILLVVLVSFVGIIIPAEARQSDAPVIVAPPPSAAGAQMIASPSPAPSGAESTASPSPVPNVAGAQIVSATYGGKNAQIAGNVVLVPANAPARAQLVVTLRPPTGGPQCSIPVAPFIEVNFVTTVAACGATSTTLHVLMAGAGPLLIGCLSTDPIQANHCKGGDDPSTWQLQVAPAGGTPEIAVLHVGDLAASLNFSDDGAAGLRLRGAISDLNGDAKVSVVLRGSAAPTASPQLPGEQALEATLNPRGVAILSGTTFKIANFAGASAELSGISFNPDGIHATFKPTLPSGVLSALQLSLPVVARFGDAAVAFGCSSVLPADSSGAISAPGVIFGRLTMRVAPLCAGAAFQGFDIAAGIVPATSLVASPLATPIATISLGFGRRPSIVACGGVPAVVDTCDVPVSYALPQITVGAFSLAARVNSMGLKSAEDGSVIATLHSHFDISANVFPTLGTDAAFTFSPGNNSAAFTTQCDQAASAKTSLRFDQLGTLEFQCFQGRLAVAGSAFRLRDPAIGELDVPSYHIDLTDGDVALDGPDNPGLSATLSLGALAKASLSGGKVRFDQNGLEVSGRYSIALPQNIFGAFNIVFDDTTLTIPADVTKSKVSIGSMEPISELSVAGGKIQACDKSSIFTLNKARDGLDICANYAPPGFLATATMSPDLRNVDVGNKPFHLSDLETGGTASTPQFLVKFTGAFIADGGLAHGGISYSCDDDACQKTKTYTDGYRIAFATFHVKHLDIGFDQTLAKYPQVSFAASADFGYPLPRVKDASIDAAFNSTGFVGLVTFKDPVTLQVSGQTLNVEAVALQLSDKLRRASARGSLTVKQLAGVSWYFREVAISQDRPQASGPWATHFELNTDVPKTALSVLGTLLGLFIGSRVIHI